MTHKGVSLLEVLMSIFILSIGILGIFAMLSLGHRMEREIDRHDSVAVCGRACLERVTLSDPLFQEFIRPSEPMYATMPITGWTSPDVGRFFYNGNLFPATTSPNDTNGLTGPVLIDPIGYAKSAGADFPPANGSEPRALLSNTTNPLTVYIPRVTPRNWGPPAANGDTQRLPMSLPVAQRLFSWSDDITVPIPDDGSRPKQTFQEGTSSNPQYAQSAGVYSWSVMVAPTDEMLGKSSRSQTKFRVWMLVYQRREIGTASPPVERTVVANLLDNGMNGGDVKLTSANAGYLDIGKDKWVLLVGVDSLRRLRCEFYRVANIEHDPVQEAAGRWAIHARLAGPDWPCYSLVQPNVDHWTDRRRNPLNPSTFTNQPFDLDQDGNACDVIAVIIDGLVGVSQRAERDIEIPPY